MNIGRQTNPVFCAAFAVIVILVSSCGDDGTAPPQRPPGNAVVRPDGQGYFPTIQAALDATANGDTIELANGTFRGVGNRDLVFRGGGVVLRSQSGDPSQCIIDCQSSSGSMHRGFTLASTDSLSVTFEGFTIANGYGLGGGGAVEVDGGARHEMHNLVIRNNGNTAIICRRSTLLIMNSRFEQNPDGALSGWSQADLECVDCTFASNRSEDSGGAIYLSSSTLRAHSCVFERNTAGFSGGAVHAWTLSQSTTASVLISESRFERNSSGYHGGAIHFTDTDYELVGCTFWSNAAPTNGGAVWSYHGSEGEFTNCVLVGNEAGKGGALNCGWDSSPLITNTIVAFNSGSAPVFCDTLLGVAEPRFQCSDIYGNYGGDWVGCIAGQGSTDGNISLDPLFCDWSHGDFQLRSDSPCATPTCGRMGSAEVGCPTP